MTERAHPNRVDWSVTTWEGSRRDQLDRWASMTLDEILAAQEEMAALSADLARQRSEVPFVTGNDVSYALVAERGPRYSAAPQSPYDLPLPGCSPEPLMAYLKALGVLRPISEQKDSEARGWWKNDVFWLRSEVLFKEAVTEDAKRTAIVKFFLGEYEPTPIVVPWSGEDFFKVKWEPRRARHAKAPTANKAIEAVLLTTTARFQAYRIALRACREALETCGIETKEGMGKRKWQFIRTLRSTCDQARVLDWIDAAAIIGAERFAPLLGSGGGSDGNTHFSDNFIQNLWDVLSDFDDQRQPDEGNTTRSVLESSRRLLEDALFAVPSNEHVPKRTSALYDSGAVGGPNASQGMQRDSLSNPWNVILGLEGTVSFACAPAKRMAANTASEAAFPFQVSASVTNRDRLAGREQAGSEVWVPLWSHPARSSEILGLLREGRAQCGARSAKTGVDMARALASLGMDRGVRAFHRYAIVKGRVGGDNYNTAVALGRFQVLELPGADLLREIDPWLERFRAACSTNNAPARLVVALRTIDSAIVEFCKYGGAALFQQILIALGASERELARTTGKVGKRAINPLGLSSDWIEAAADRSAEFAIGLALASVHDPERTIGPLRVNLEPVAARLTGSGERYSEWIEKDRTVVWSAADLITNLAAVLDRRLIAAWDQLPLASHFTVSLAAIAAFLAGELNDDRVADLIWGLMLIDDRHSRRQQPFESDGVSVPRAYGLLKLLFLPRPLVIERRDNGRLFARLRRNGESGGIAIRPEPSILRLLQGRRLGEACAIAMRRLRASQLGPMPQPIRGRRVRDGDWRELDGISAVAVDQPRLAAALLVPISDRAVTQIVRLVIPNDEIGCEHDQTRSMHLDGDMLS